MANPQQKVVQQRRHTHKSYMTGRTEYTLKEVYDQFGTGLPRMFIVKTGYEGEIVEKPIQKGQILRLECTTSKERLAARAITNDGRIQYFSFYEHTSVIDAKSPTTGQSIQSMMQDRKLPVTVSLKRSQEGVSEASQLQFLNYFEERYLAGNIIHLDFFDQDVIYIPTYLSKVRLVEVLGIKGDTAESSWKKYQDKCERIAGGLEYDTQFTRIDIAVLKDVPNGIVTSETEAERHIQLSELHNMCMASEVYEALAMSLKESKQETDEELTEDDIYVEVSKLLTDKMKKDFELSTTKSPEHTKDEDTCRKVREIDGGNENIYEVEPEDEDRAEDIIKELKVESNDERPPVPPRLKKEEVLKIGSKVTDITAGFSVNSKYMNNVPRGEASVVRKVVDSSDSDDDYEEVSPDDKLASPRSDLIKPSSADKGAVGRQLSKEKSFEHPGSPKAPKSPFKSKHFLDDLSKIFGVSKPSTEDKVVAQKYAHTTKPQATSSRPIFAAKPIATIASSFKDVTPTEQSHPRKSINATVSEKSNTSPFNVQRNVNQVKPISATTRIDAGKTEKTNTTAADATNKSDQVKPVAAAKPTSDARLSMPVTQATAKVPSAGLPKVEKGADVQTLSIEEVCGYLKKLRLGKLVDTFQREMVDGMILSSLDAKTFVSEFGLSGLEAARLEKFAHYGHLPS